jgi:hypothetical protein
MNHASWKALDRVLAQIDRRNRRPRRVSTAAVVLAVGLGLSYLLLVQLVPQVWPALLDSEPGEALRGWPLLVWKLAEFCQARQPLVLAGFVSASALLLVLTYRFRLLRPVAWVAAVVVVFADAGIVVSTILACLQAAGADV